MNIKQITCRKLSTHKGAKRLWLEGLRLAAAGFTPGAHYHMNISREAGTVRLELTDNGKRIVSRKKSGRAIPEYRPVIDLNSRDLDALFGDSDRVQVVICERTIEVSLHSKDKARQVRESRLKTRLCKGVALAVGSMCAGAGILDHALHTGLADSSIASRLAWAIESEYAYLQAGMENNPIWGGESVPVHARAEDVEPTLLEPVDVLVAGLPCTGASKAGRAKNKLRFAEAHESAGTAFIAFLAIVRAANPAAIILENVPEYEHTASMQVIRDVLSDLGYRVETRIVDSSLGALENRKRMCMVAMTEGVGFDFVLAPTRVRESCLGDVLEDVDENSPTWRECAYLDRKEAMDRAAGKGFRMQVLTPSAKQVGTIGRHYAKWRSTEPLIQHPTTPKLRRLLTPAEHARVKTIPESLVSGLSATTAHQCLGQSVLHCAFVAVGRALGRAFAVSQQAVGAVQNVNSDPISRVEVGGQISMFS